MSGPAVVGPSRTNFSKVMLALSDSMLSLLEMTNQAKGVTEVEDNKIPHLITPIIEFLAYLSVCLAYSLIEISMP